MNNKITVSALVNEKLKKVWDYYTNPSHIVNWNFADPSWHCPSAINDLKIGGTYKARMEAKDGSAGFDFEVIYTNIIKEKELSYEFGGRSATITFDVLGDKTQVVIVFDPEKENPIELQKNGWQSILDNFKSYVEKK